MTNYSAFHWSEKAKKSAEEAKAIKESLGVVYIFKGSVNTIADLPNNANIGDVYDVLDSGTNYAWTGDKWDSLGASFDLSEYAKKEYVDTTEQEIIQNFMDADTALQTQITGLAGVLDSEQDKIVAIEGKIPTNASTSNMLSTASDLLNATQDVRSDFADADNELQIQINGQVGEIADIKEQIKNFDALPSQTGNAGKYLTTDGTNASWSEIQQSGYHPDILSCQWSDHLIDNMSWLRADTFSWHKGDIYTSAYQHLVDDYNNATVVRDYESSNINKTDNIVDNSGIISGFTGTTDYASIGSYISTPTSSFEIVIKCKQDTLTSTGSILAATTQYSGIVLRCVNASTGQINMWVGYGNGTNFIRDVNTNCTLTAGVWTYLKVASNGTNYTVSQSSDGENWTTNYTVANTNMPNWNTAHTQNLGGCTWESFPFTNGQIDLNECYLNIDGNRVWDGCTYTFPYYQATDGHKICDPDQEDKIRESYEKHGVAWYYILDTANQRFKLPRENPAREELVTDSTSVFKGKKYLYFYVGQFTQTATEQTAGLNAELFNGKVDLDFNNMNPSASAKETIVGWGMPDYSAVISGVGNNYTAPSNGIFWFSLDNNNTENNIYITTIDGVTHDFVDVHNGYGSSGGYPVLLNKGEIITISSNSSTLMSSYFIPLKGVSNA